MADETFSAKQVARRIGTDAKTFRKWLRSSSSPYPAVGQGKRYEFPQDDLHRIKLHFEAWKNKSSHKTKSIADFGLGKVNGHSHPKVAEEPPMERLADSSLVPRKKLNKAEFEAERKARQAARDEEYGTIDGEYPEEPTREDLEALLENNELPSDEELEELED